MNLLRDPDDPGVMTAAARDQELAALLARGYLRSREVLRNQVLPTVSEADAAPFEELSKRAQNDLDEPPHTERPCPHG